jgi:hypothetical protein
LVRCEVGFPINCGTLCHASFGGHEFRVELLLQSFVADTVRSEGTFEVLINALRHEMVGHIAI